MEPRDEQQPFRSINRGYDSVFEAGHLSLGLVVPIERYARGPVPEMERHLERVRLAEDLGFAAVWLRDVPFDVPSFGDAGQPFDPFVYLGYLAARTERITLGVASIILPLRHPAHVAKAAATTDVLSGGRLVLGVASGDRPEEYPALSQPFADRGQRFRESFEYIRRVGERTPVLDSALGHLDGSLDLLPKPTGGQLPLLVTGGSQQAPEWIAAHGDGWMVYPRPLPLQARILADWRARVAAAGRPSQPVLQPLYVDLTDDPDTAPTEIHLGYRLGANPLRALLKELQKIGVHHVALNLRFNQADIESTMHRLAKEVLPELAK